MGLLGRIGAVAAAAALAAATEAADIAEAPNESVLPNSLEGFDKRQSAASPMVDKGSDEEFGARGRCAAFGMHSVVLALDIEGDTTRSGRPGGASSSSSSGGEAETVDVLLSPVGGGVSVFVTGVRPTTGTLLWGALACLLLSATISLIILSFVWRPATVRMLWCLLLLVLKEAMPFAAVSTSILQGVSGKLPLAIRLNRRYSSAFDFDGGEISDIGASDWRSETACAVTENKNARSGRRRLWRKDDRQKQNLKNYHVAARSRVLQTALRHLARQHHQNLETGSIWKKNDGATVVLGWNATFSYIILTKQNYVRCPLPTRRPRLQAVSPPRPTTPTGNRTYCTRIVNKINTEVSPLSADGCNSSTSTPPQDSTTTKGNSAHLSSSGAAASYP